MNILGISGLENATTFKQSHWPDLDPREYRIVQGQDAAAALVCGGQLVGAAAEERFDGRKHSGAFPFGAASYCLAERGITINQIDEIAHGFDYSPYEKIYSLDPLSAEQYRHVFSRESLLEQVKKHFSRLSPRESSPRRPSFGARGQRLLHGRLGRLPGSGHRRYGRNSVRLHLRGRDGKLEKLREISANHSIGILYSLVTFHLGFDFNSDEYKIMGLAPYGESGALPPFLRRGGRICGDGSIRIPILGSQPDSRDERESYLRQPETTWMRT